MIPYTRDPAKTIPPSSVKIIGLGGAGANMLERIALDGMEGTELCALNTDIRTLGACIAKEKIQLGTNLTKGLGAGGDPELGNKAVLEAEAEIRASLKEHKIVFVCTGLGGGTGSGAAPIVTRIAREEGAFVVVFATTPFAFEGDRRRDQAEAALNELAVLSNALVTFDNNRMGELVLAKQGIHEAFAAADQMISESIKSVIRLVVRPGLINVGLDELMAALKTNRSRCLFGSGMADGADRASKALRSALASPLLDEGSLLKDSQSVLVHLCGGEDLTLFEVELLMQQLQKHVPEKAQVLFGAAIDPSLGNSLSVTLISALPEEALAKAPRKAISQAEDDSPLVNRGAPTPQPQANPDPKPEPTPEPEAGTEAEEKPLGKAPGLFDENRPFAEPALETNTDPEPKEEPKPEPAPEPKAEPALQPKAEPDPQPKAETAPSASKKEEAVNLKLPERNKSTEPASSIPPKRDGGAAPWRPKIEKEPTAQPKEDPASQANEPQEGAKTKPTAQELLARFAEEDGDKEEAKPEPKPEPKSEPSPQAKPEPAAQPKPEPTAQPKPEPTAQPKAEPTAQPKPEPTAQPKAEPTAQPKAEPPPRTQAEPIAFKPNPAEAKSDEPPLKATALSQQEEPGKEVPKLKLGAKPAASGSDELSLDSSPRGRFEGEDPNVVDGEDLDLPPFLRKKK